jgi:4a-hydroxytetrahydrobiopterin dehydratase
MEDLTKKKCVPCEGGVPSFEPKHADEYLRYTSGWKTVDYKSIEREFFFKDFKEAMAFINKVAKIAESEGHHPDIYIFYNKVRLANSTHAISGLSENDFILAAKINKLVPFAS